MAEPGERDEQGRVQPPVQASELEMAAAFLDFHRATLLWKIQGVSHEDLRRAMVPSGTSLLGLVKHLADVDQSWFVEVFQGEDPVVHVWDPDDPNSAWRIEPHETTQDIVDLYLRACEASRRAIEGASPEDHARKEGFERYTLRWILAHMIEETARHNGHADIIRELIDGSTGE